MEAVRQMSSLRLTKEQNRRCKKKDTYHTEFLCELFEAKAARGRYFVHELTSGVKSRNICVAMPGTRTAVADLCMFGLAACDARRPVFINAKAHRHARVNANNTIERRTNRNMGTSSCPNNGGKVEKGLVGAEDAGTEAEDAKRTRGIVHEKNKNKRMSHVQHETEKLVHHDEQKLLSVWER